MSATPSARPRSGLRVRGSELPAALRRTLMAIALLALMFFAYITAIRLAYVLVYIAVLLVAVSWLWTRLGIRGLSLRRDAPEGKYEAGETFVEHLELDNGSLLGLPWVEVVDEAGVPGYAAGRVFSLGGRKSRRWRSDGRFIARGAYLMGPIRIATGDPFGLFQASREIPSASRVIVYPRLVDPTPIMSGISGANGDTVAVGRQVDTPPEAFGIREYNPDDGVNRIHWPSTARLGRPMSRSFEKYEGADLVVVLDLGREGHSGTGAGSTLECAVTLAASVAMTGASRGQAVGLVCNDLARTNISPGRGAAHLGRILEALALAEADGLGGFDRTVESALVARGDQKLYVITPNATDRWVDRLGSAPRGSTGSTIVRLVPGGGGQGSRRARRTTGSGTWWEIGTADEVFATSPGRQRGAGGIGGES